MAFMVAAYMVIWLAVFVFVFMMMRRERQLESDIAALKEATTEDHGGR
jgi:CcmD family protein